MRAEEDRLARSAVRLEPAEDVPHRRADLRAGVVLVGFEPEGREILEHAVGDGPLLAWRARKRRQLDEQRENVWCPSGLATRRS